MKRPNANNTLKHNYFKNLSQQQQQNNRTYISSSRSPMGNKINSNKVNEMVNSISMGNNLMNTIYECK